MYKTAWNQPGTACRQFEKGSPVNPEGQEHVGMWLITSHLAFCPHVPGHGSRHLLRMQVWSRLHSVFSTHSGRQASYGLPTYSGEHSHTPPGLSIGKKGWIRILQFMLLVPCIFLQLIHQPTNILNKIQLMTSIKLLYVLALGCHPQGAF